MTFGLSSCGTTSGKKITRLSPARLDGTWLMLDNGHMAMIEDHHVRDYHPVFLLDHDGVSRYSDAPSTSAGSRGHERTVGQILH